MAKKGVAVISGGMDSAVSAAVAKAEGIELIAVHFDYGQRTEAKERECFEKLCIDLNVTEKYLINLPFFAEIGASALTDPRIAVPTGGVEDGVPVTYVPFRNGIFLSIASAIAEKEGAESIYIGVVEEDSSGYPDCRESYIEAMERAIDLGTRETTQISIQTPLVHLKKSDIVKKALELGVDLSHTWSCYRSQEKACGVCDSCRLRLRGFKEAGARDPIEYATGEM